ncbi:MAG: hypothetical protein J7497_16350 [Chitinophagaceae bacterium]|nr:hypothetical protein [Chitinophagaceae bacterium]
MSNTITLTATVAQTFTLKQSSIFSRFIAWCENQQENRFLWLGIALAGQQRSLYHLWY